MGLKTVRFLVRLYIILAVSFGGLSVFAAVVPWAKPVLPIVLANMVLTAAMAVMNSVLLDRLKGK